MNIKIIGAIICIMTLILPMSGCINSSPEKYRFYADIYINYNETSCVEAFPKGICLASYNNHVYAAILPIMAV